MSGSAVRAGRSFIEVFLKDQVSAGLRSMVVRLRGISSMISGLGRGLVFTSLALAAPIAFATRTYADFSSQMGVVRGVTDATAGEFALLNDNAKELGRSTSFLARQVAEAQTELGRAGFNPTQIIAANSAVLALARSTDTELAESAKIAAATLRGFQMEAAEMGRVADVLSVTTNNSATELIDLGEGMKFVAPLAVEAKESLEATAWALGILADNGIRGTLAGNALGRAYKNLSNATVRETLKGINVEALDADKNLRPLAAIIRDVGAATAGMGTAQRLDIFEQLFGRGQAAALKLAAPTARFADLLEKIDQAAGKAQKSADKMADNLGGDLIKAQSAAEGIAIAFSEQLEPMFRSVTQQAIAAAGGITKFIEENQAYVVLATIAVAATATLGVGLTAIGAAAWLASVPLSVLSTLSAALGTVLGALTSVLWSTVTGLFAHGTATTVSTTAVSLYSAACVVARVVLATFAGAVGLASGVLLVMRGAVVGVTATLTLLSATSALLRSGMLATSAAVATFRLTMLFTGDTMRAVTAAWRTFTAALGAGRAVTAAGVLTLTAVRVALVGMTAAASAARVAMAAAWVQQLAFAGSTAVLAVVRAVWASITAAVITARGAITAASIAQLAFASGAAILNVVRSAWGSLTLAVIAATGAMALASSGQIPFEAAAVVVAVAGAWIAVRSAIAIARLQQASFAAGAAAIATLRAIWEGLGLAALTARAAITLANVGQLAMAGGAAVLSGVRSVWAGLTAAVVTCRAAMTLANLHQLTFAAGATVLGAVEAAWRGAAIAAATCRGAISLAAVSQLAMAAGAAVLSGVRAAWSGVTFAVVAARGAITLANVSQLGMAAGAALLAGVRTIWAGLTFAVIATRGAITLAAAGQLAMAAGGAILAVIRGAWLATAGAVSLTGVALAAVQGVTIGTASAMALLSAGLAAVQAAALGPLAPIAAIVAAVVGLGALLYLNRETVFDALGEAVAGLQPILDASASSWSSFATGISEWFGAVVSEARTAWEGISAAIAINDLQAAWGIAWNTMRLVALQTYGPLQVAWAEFTTGLISAFDGAIVAIRSGWSSAATAIAQTMFSVLGTIQDLLDKIAEFDPTGAAAALRGLVEFDVDGINTMLDEDHARFTAGLQSERDARDETRGAELNTRLAALRAAQEEAEAEIRRIRDAAVQRAKGKKESQDAERKQQKEEAEAAAAEAEEQRQKLEAELGKLGEQANNAGRSPVGSGQSSGTFSGVAAAMLQFARPSETPEEKQLREIKKSAARIAASNASIELHIAELGTVA